MARLPDNIERLRDGRGYRYRAYSLDGFSIRLNRDPYSKLWHGYTTLTGAYVGCGQSLVDIGAKCAAYKVM
jgi:hypothetical protein